MRSIHSRLEKLEQAKPPAPVEILVIHHDTLTGTDTPYKRVTVGDPGSLQQFNPTTGRWEGVPIHDN
jgi:hypothetical protein